MVPVVKGHSLYEIMQYWSLNDLYIYHQNLFYEGLHDKQHWDKQEALSKMQDRFNNSE